jgi:hypothetical protein
MSWLAELANRTGLVGAALMEASIGPIWPNHMIHWLTYGVVGFRSRARNGILGDVHLITSPPRRCATPRGRTVGGDPAPAVRRLRTPPSGVADGLVEAETSVSGCRVCAGVWRLPRRGYGRLRWAAGHVRILLMAAVLPGRSRLMLRWTAITTAIAGFAECPNAGSLYGRGVRD